MFEGFKLPARAVVCSSLLVACGSNDTQMTSAIQETLTAVNGKRLFGGSACLLLPLADAVMRGADGQPAPIFAEAPSTVANLRVLASLGLLRPENPGMRGELRFVLTQEGFKYLRHEETSHFAFGWNWALCSGAMKVTNIESYTKPSDVLGQTVTSVSYRYAIEGAAEWAKDPKVQALSPPFARHFQQPVSSMDLVQTNEGWRSIYMQQRDAGLAR